MSSLGAVVVTGPGPNPVALAVHPAGKFLYVVNQSAGSIGCIRHYQ
ncbi:MAG: hypothetical protein WDO12_09635 [Pseudomonadota bacterium]